MDRNIEQNRIGVSVIMPIYNSEKYIDTAIKSVQAQSYKNFELLLIDDGSTDKSGEIGRRYQNSDARVKYIYKDNGGVCSARNLGISIAQGEYISFIDNDDEYDPKYLSLLTSIAERYQSDIIKCGRRNILITPELKVIKTQECGFPDTKHYSYKEFMQQYECIKKDGSFNSVWNGLYKASFIKDQKLIFDEEIRHGNEDMIFNYQALKCKPDICVLKDVLYVHYYRMSHSTSSKYYADQVTDRLKAITVESELLKDISSKDAVEAIRFEEFRDCIRLLSACGDKQEKSHKIKMIENTLGRDVFCNKHIYQYLNAKQRLDWKLFKNRWYGLYFTYKRVQRLVER